MTHADAIARLRLRCAEVGSQAALAREIGVNRSFINNILHGRQDFTAPVLKAIGLEKQVVYQERKQ